MSMNATFKADENRAATMANASVQNNWPTTKSPQQFTQYSGRAVGAAQSEFATSLDADFLRAPFGLWLVIDDAPTNEEETNEETTPDDQ